MYPIQHMAGHGFGWGGWIIGLIMMLLFWGAIISLIILAFRALRGGSAPSAPAAPPANSALEILNIRYAKGEIDKAAYDAIRKDIG